MIEVGAGAAKSCVGFCTLRLPAAGADFPADKHRKICYNKSTALRACCASLCTDWVWGRLSERRICIETR